jgi:diadenosine tetraphosphatase ApaH/serine/threonine PP2A family protein phosphatase
VRYLVLSDLHANLEAFDAVLADAAAVGYDQVLVLGDLVGYGADPGPVIDRTLALQPVALIRGNHDKVCAGIEPPVLFNEIARRSIEWTASVVSADQLRVLHDLPKGPAMVTGELEICHGAPFDEDHYLFDIADAARAFSSAGARICLFGHTHLPAVFAMATDPVQSVAHATGEDLTLPVTGPALINVGSVGQPRDGDPRAAYGILDLEARVLLMRRVAYDVKTAKRKILDAGLPEWLGLRLEKGR